MAKPSQPKKPKSSARILGSRIHDQLVIAKRIGKGRLSDVYSASHPVLARRFAVKLFKTALTRTAKVQSRLRHAVRESSVVDHPKVVGLVDYGTLENGRQYLTMDYLRGTALFAQLKRGRPFELSRTLSLLAQLAEALEAAHLARVAHGDVKPSNIILLEVPGGSEDLRLLDLRLTQALSEEATKSDPLRHLRVYSALEYVSPELIAGAKPAPTTDVYSFGALAYRLLCGVPPFVGTAREIIRGHSTQEPLPVRSQAAASGVPRMLESVVMQCLRKEPTERYPSMCEALAELSPLFRMGAASAASEPRAVVVPPPIPSDTDDELLDDDDEETPAVLPRSTRAVRVLFYESIVRLARIEAERTPQNAPLATELSAVDGLQRDLAQVRHQLADPEERLAAVRQELREREATLRYAIVDLNWTRTRLEERGIDGQEITDVTFQAAELEQRLTQLERERGTLLGALQTELSGSRQKATALEQRLVPHYRTLYEVLKPVREKPPTQPVRRLSRLIEQCLVELAQTQELPPPIPKD